MASLHISGNPTSRALGLVISVNVPLFFLQTRGENKVLYIQLTSASVKNNPEPAIQSNNLKGVLDLAAAFALATCLSCRASISANVGSSAVSELFAISCCTRMLYMDWRLEGWPSVPVVGSVELAIAI